jgi:hypothetical protein
VLEYARIVCDYHCWVLGYVVHTGHAVAFYCIHAHKLKLLIYPSQKLTIELDNSPLVLSIWSVQTKNPHTLKYKGFCVLCEAIVSYSQTWNHMRYIRNSSQTFESYYHSYSKVVRLGRILATLPWLSLLIYPQRLFPLFAA